jgi:uncharacterized protein
MLKAIILYSIYYGSFLAFPLLILTIWFFYKKKKRAISTFFILLSLLFIYSRFIEPQILVVRQAESGLDAGVHFALVSDLHNGVYKGEKFLHKIVDELNKQSVDFILIPGDFVYNADPDKLNELFSAFEKLEAPVYAVLGNHDNSPAGEITDQNLELALENASVQLIDNEIITFPEDRLQLVGLGELWNGETDISILDATDPEMEQIVFVHNPDVAYLMPEDEIELIVAGHTHGGQIRIPWLYKKIIPTEYDFGDGNGLFFVNGNRLYITSGAGEIGLPMRLAVPPEIVVLYGRI